MQINPIKIFTSYQAPLKTNFLGGKTNFSNLSPLDKDTVSFSGKTLKSDVKKTNNSERPALRTAQRIYEDSDYAYGQLRYILSQTFDMPVIDINSHKAKEKMDRAINDNRKKPVIMITSRRKSPNSIAEKMASWKLRSMSSTKNTLNDIIGAKIVVSGTSTREGDYVLDKLTEAVKKGRLKIKEIKNHNQGDKTLNYATKAKINKLLNAARKTNSTCTYIDQPRDTGYLAIHIITDEITDGYSAEIQIMGLDVAKFKEIEDFCYKCRAEKEIPPELKEFKDIFQILNENPKLNQEYMEYTKKAYAHERKKGSHKAENSGRFLPIPKGSSLPKALDFNKIASTIKMTDKKEAPSN